MNNIQIFENDLPSNIDLSNEKVLGLDSEALGLTLGRDPLTLIQIGLQSKKFYLVQVVKILKSYTHSRFFIIVLKLRLIKIPELFKQ